MQNRPALTVSALTKYIKVKLENDQHLKTIYLKGEISNFTHHRSGHLYFTLKDDNAQIRAMMFQGYANSLTFKPKDGDDVIIRGSISLYEPRGDYSIVVNQMELAGIGELYKELERLKKMYEELGYFDQSSKKPIPKFPQKIGVITSSTGAVIQDIRNTVNRRYPLTKILLYPSKVQGEGAALDIASKIKRANDLAEVDVLIVGRGGGSIEDLWAFNEAIVVEAIYSSKIPIIAAIGHETDFTISDFVADLRSPTPTAAAEQATPNIDDLVDDLEYTIKKINTLFKDIIENKKIKILNLDQRIYLLSPQNKLKSYTDKVKNYNVSINQLYRLVLNKYNQKFDRLYSSLKPNYEKVYLNKRQNFFILTEKLSGLNPLTYLSKGFALTKIGEKITTSINDVDIGDELSVTYQDGTVLTKVVKKGEV